MTQAREFFRAQDQTNGFANAGIAVGYLALRGRGVPIDGPVVVLFRRTTAPQFGAWLACGIDHDFGGTILDGLAHAANTMYQYAAVVLQQNGQVSRIPSPIVSAAFDATPVLIVGSLPAAVNPKHVGVQSIAGGKYRIRWNGELYGGSVPADYQVFEGADEASIDYGTPLVDSVTALNFVAFNDPNTPLEFTTAAFTQDTRHAFAVRGRNAAGVANPTQFGSGKTGAFLTAPTETHLTSNSFSGQA